jgi:succinoglycan biosynthesis transport protein ExoP
MRTILPATTGEMPIDRGLVASGARHPGPPSAVTLKRLQRYFGAVKQYKWMILAIVGAAIGAGLLATRFVPPSYEVNATLWISAETARRQDRGPIRGQELVAASGWVELLRSVALSESIVRQLGLYLKPSEANDSLPFIGFGIKDHVVPGLYTLRVDGDGQKYALLRKKELVERGVVGDSVGRSVGFLWQPKALTAGKEHDFSIVEPHEAAVTLLNALNASLPDGSSFLRVSLTGKDRPILLATIVNRWLEAYIRMTGQLKRRNLTEFVGILDGQLNLAEARLRGAESALENFRVQTITLPQEGGPVAAGVEQTRDPVFQDYFKTKLEYESVHRDREALEHILRDAPSAGVDPEMLFAVPAVVVGNERLKAAIGELATKEAQLRTARLTYTDKYKGVQDLERATGILRQQTIPDIARASLEEFKLREAQLASRIDGASTELRRIPSRTIEEMRLRREVAVAENLYTTLLTRYGEAKLTEASETPDVAVLDSAVAPNRPTRNTAPKLMLLAVLGGLGFAIALVIVLDMVDARFRYPEQATDELGLDIVGFMPRLTQNRNRSIDPLLAAQLTEGIRCIRVGLRSTTPDGAPLMLTISSPCSGDGKSLLAANLAVSFAEAGYKTLLIDGDVRRGALASTFNVRASPGLMEYLRAPELSLRDIVHPTLHPNLVLIPSGARSRRGVELLASEQLRRLIVSAPEQFDVVLVDTPPLGVGVDAFAMGIATGSMLLVLRTGKTNRKLAEAKLEFADRLPIRMLGAVLNDVRAQGIYEYYSYTPRFSEPIGERIGIVDEGTVRARA